MRGILFLSKDYNDVKDPLPPYTVVRLLPLLDFGVHNYLPVLFIEGITGEVTPSREVMVWAKASLAGYSLSKVDHDVRVLARFIDFYRLWFHGRSLDDGDLDYLVYAYLVQRYAGTLDAEGRCSLHGLNWRPLSYVSLKSEFVALSRYLRFCATTWGFIDLNPNLFRTSIDDPPVKRMRDLENRRDEDFFVHLGAAREWWQQRYADTDLKLPPIARSPQKPQKFRNFPTNDEVWAIIDAETNPIFRSLWLIGAFGGIRISEQLNMWQVDILPGSSREHFFTESTIGSTNTLLVLRADPNESRYIDHPGTKGPTRRQHLWERYTTLPRTSLPRSDPMYAGWKGTVYSGEFLTHQVFWIDEHAADLFAECAVEIRRFHRHHETSRRHPWYYVNISDPTGEYRGDPMKIGRVERAFEDACMRVGLKPHTWGRNLHGLRHHYKAFAEEQLNIPPEHIQVMLGHRRIESQNEYGKNARSTNQALSSAMTHRNKLLAG